MKTDPATPKKQWIQPEIVLISTNDINNKTATAVHENTGHFTPSAGALFIKQGETIHNFSAGGPKTAFVS